MDDQFGQQTSTSELLAYLQRLNVEVAADAERLVCSAPKGVLSPELEKLISSRKPQILDLLQNPKTMNIGNAGGKHSPDPSCNPVCLHEWFEHQVERTPESIAVVCGSERLTYHELNARSNRLANRLCALGVNTEIVVAIYLDRSIDLVISVLGVLKAGGAYLPLDPECPQERLLFMVRESGAAMLLTTRDLGEGLPQQSARVFYLDREKREIGLESAENLAVKTRPENLAFVLFTSGSTGKPKGAQIEHRSVTNLIAAMLAEPLISPQDCWLAVTTFAFDIASLEILMPLIVGARLFIAPRKTLQDGYALARLLRESGASIMFATPVTWRLLLDSEWDGLPRLKMLCGGEVLTRELADRLLVTGGKLLNVYGPTETTIFSTVFWVGAGSDTIPIGKPIAHTQVYVLDEQRQPVASGAAGELYIGGAGVARGYCQRPDLTAERFLPSPFRPGERLYRTGDLVRQRDDGNLEFIGRQDQQVKLRGCRIELVEIEAVLEQQPGVRQAVVIVREDQPGDQRLTAYVRSVSPGNGQALRQALAAVLPDYMIPSAFVFLEKFPLLPNQKINREAFAAPLAEPAGQRRAETETERRVAAIWCSVLDVPEVGVDDDFFDLGGHSLLIVRVQSRIRQEFGIDLSIADLFEQRTVAANARQLDEIQDRQSAFPGESNEHDPHSCHREGEPVKYPCLVPAQPKGARRPLFLVAGFQGPDDALMVSWRIIPHMGPDQPIYGFKPRWVDGGDVYESVEEEAGEYLSALRNVQPHGPYLIAGYCISGLVALEMSRQLMEQGEEIDLLALIDTERPTAVRTFCSNAWAAWLRTKHKASVIADAVQTADRSRRNAAVALLRRKLRDRFRPSQRQILPEDRFYRSKLAYTNTIRKYAAGQYPGRITLIVNEKWSGLDQDRGWKRFPARELIVKTAPGDHLTIFTRYGKELAQLLLESMDQATHESPKAEIRAAAS